MVYDLKASKEQVIKDLIEGKGWNFLKHQNIWTGEVADDSIWWDDFSGGWHDIWNQFLLNLGSLYDRLPDIRETHMPFENFMKDGQLEYLYASKNDFIFHFLLECAVPNSDVVEWAPELNEIKELGYDQVFVFDELYKSKSLHTVVDEHGIRTWKKIIKINYDLSKIPDNVWFKTKSVKEKFYIMDSKSKYGTLRVSLSFCNDDMGRLEYELEHISMFTCERCGKQPRNSKGEHIIWQSKGYWIEQYCKKCARLNCYQDRHCEYKDALLTGQPYKGEPTIKSMMDKGWLKIKDDKVIKVHSYSKDEEKIESWHHWESFYDPNCEKSCLGGLIIVQTIHKEGESKTKRM